MHIYAKILVELIDENGKISNKVYSVGKKYIISSERGVEYFIKEIF